METNKSGRLLRVLHSHRLTIKLKEWLYHTEDMLMNFRKQESQKSMRKYVRN